MIRDHDRPLTLDDLGISIDPKDLAAFPEIEVGWWLDEIARYLPVMESLLRDETSRIAEEDREMWKTGGGSMLGDYSMRLEHLFPSILRRSFFLAVYFSFEAGLYRACGLVQKANVTKAKEALERSNVREALRLLGSSIRNIEEAMDYLKRVGGIAFDKESSPGRLWSDLCIYRRVRNCLAHSDGYLTPKDQKLRKQCEGEPHLAVSRGFFGDQIEVLPGFCEKVVKTMREFFTELDGELRDEGYQLDPEKLI